MSEEDYLHELIPALLRQGQEDRLEWKQFVRAISYLAKPPKLIAAASDHGINLADRWKTTNHPGFELAHVPAAIRELGGENLAIETVGTKRYIVLKHRTAPESEPSVKLDADVAMAVVRSESSVIRFDQDESDLEKGLGHLAEALG